ncbi:hypothetical protein RND81_01G155500 [Saponaria officinalis]|uniref:Reverse transcriptase n=1 Tax=Saponaria officinalis TaxID=3572 RepID=A0AAW1NFM8_SAPOF
MNLYDVPAKGPKFTWCNKRDGIDRLFEHLDKAYASDDWFAKFPDVGVTHYPIQFSDHAPIEVNVFLNDFKWRRPHKIEAWNLEMNECLDIIKKGWSAKIKGSVDERYLRKISWTRKRLKGWSLEKRQERGESGMTSTSPWRKLC